MSETLRSGEVTLVGNEGGVSLGIADAAVDDEPRKEQVLLEY